MKPFIIRHFRLQCLGICSIMMKNEHWRKVSAMRAWEKNIRRVEPYVPGEQPKVDNVIKLNTNENPYPPAPKAYEAAKHLIWIS